MLVLIILSLMTISFLCKWNNWWYIGVIVKRRLISPLTFFYFIILLKKSNIHFHTLKWPQKTLKHLLTIVNNLFLCLKTNVLQSASIMTLTWIFADWPPPRCCSRQAGIRELLKRRCCCGWKKRTNKIIFFLFFSFLGVRQN